MKKILRVLPLILITILLLFTLVKTPVQAVSLDSNSVPYTTYTLGTNSRLVKTQTSYVPVGYVDFIYEGEKVNLSGASDVFYFDNELYIANTDAKAIIVSDLKGNVKRYLTKFTYQGEIIKFIKPTGIFADQNFIYVADKENGAVYKINNEDECVLKVGKPNSAIYGTDTPYAPTKVAVQSSGSMYIVSEGTTTGVIETNYAGEFVGFLGINTVSVSLQTTIYRLFYGKENTAKQTGSTPLNLALGEKSSILTVNSNSNKETIKRLNIDGQNTFGEDTYYPTVNLADITMSENNYIYSVSEEGDIFEYDRNGNLLFTFNVKKRSGQVLGLLSAPKGIVVDNNENIYVLDGSGNDTGVLSIYQKTVFVTLVHRAMSLYNEGKYTESKPVFEEIIRQNSSFAKAHSALGMALYKEGNFKEALSEFKLAKDYSGYSSSFWEIRNIWIQNNSTFIFLVILGLIVLTASLQILKKHTAVLKKVEGRINVLAKKKTISECVYSFHMLKHPIDSMYGIKRGKKASFLSATIMFILFIIVYVLNIYLSGFLFKNKSSREGALMNIIILTAIILLYIVATFLISSINDGEGKFKDIYISTIYSFTPYTVMILPLTLLTHVLTYNEKIIYTIYMFIVIGWCAVNIIISISEINNYGFWDTVKCIVLTLFTMAIAALFLFLIYTFITQLLSFLSSIIKEVIYRG